MALKARMQPVGAVGHEEAPGKSFAEPIANGDAATRDVDHEVLKAFSDPTGDTVSGVDDGALHDVLAKFRLLDDILPLSNVAEFCVISKKGANRLFSIENARREALQHAISAGVYDQQFENIAAYKGGAAQFGQIKIDHELPIDAPLGGNAKPVPAAGSIDQQKIKLAGCPKTFSFV